MYKNKILEIGDDTNTSTLIFLHGFGEKSVNYIDLSKEIRRFLPNMKIILPKARIITLSKNKDIQNTGWFDLTEYPITKNYNNNGLYIDYSINLINQIIQQEIKKGIPTNKIFIGGFSQGGAMALISGLKYDGNNLGGIIVMSGWIFKNHDLSNKKSNKNIPTYIAHGMKDNVVLFENAISIKNTLYENNFKNITFKSYENLGHGKSKDEINDLIKWLGKMI